MTVAATAKFTHKDYRTLPENGKRYQVVEGELIMSPSPKKKHQQSLIMLVRKLAEYVEQRRLGSVFCAPFDVVLSDCDIVQPDILFVSDKRRDIITEDNVKGAPDLVVEILSESTRKLDKGAKRKLYEKHGVKEYWMVSPEGETIEVLTLTTDGYTTAGLYGKSHTLTSPLFADLRLVLAEIFA